MFIYFDIEEPVKDSRNFEIAPRGAMKYNILDRNNQLLVTTINSYNFYIIPSKTVFIKETAGKVSALFPEIEEEEIVDRLKTKKNKQILIKKEITEEQKRLIIESGIEAAEFENTYSRVYPYSNVFSHIIGFVNSYMEGVQGLERSFNNELYYKDIKTSLDARIQAILHAKLTAAFQEYKSLSAFGIVSNVQNGEILATVSLPDFNPKKIYNASSSLMVNNAVSSVYQLGSVFKILNIALGIENGVQENQLFKVDNKIHVDRTFLLKDEKIKKSYLTPAEILAFSSNVGSGLILEQAGIEKQRPFLEALGVFFAPKVELSPYEIATPLYKAGAWPKSMHYTTSYGYGIALSPIHFVQVVSSLIFDGKRRNLTFLKHESTKTEEYERVISQSTAKIIQSIIREVVVKGTAKRANINGYEICGKTSTSLKFDSQLRKWTNKKKMVSFLAFFPCSNPKYLVYIGIDEPIPTEKDKILQGGTVTAPVAANVISEIAPILNIKPDFKLK